MPDPTPAPARRRHRWGKLPLIAIAAAGVIAVVVIATVHPWWETPKPAFTLKSISVSFAGSGASEMIAQDLCVSRCPLTAVVGQQASVGFSVIPSPSVTCGSSTYYTITKVKETTTAGAFSISGVTAGANKTHLPVTIPDPLTGPDCVTTAELTVTFLVSDSGTPTQTVALVVTVTQS